MMAKTNYIKHLNTWFVVFKQQEEARPVHASIYLALFQMWNINRFSKSFVLSRSNLMQVSKVKSNKTHSEALKDMVAWGWIEYKAGSTFFGLSNFSLKPWNDLQKMIKKDDDMMFVSGVADDTGDVTEGTSVSTLGDTPTDTLGDTPDGKPFYKSNTDSNKPYKPKYNTKDYGNYDEAF